MKNLPRNVALAMRLIDSSKGLTDDPEIIALIDGARATLALSSEVFRAIDRDVDAALEGDAIDAERFVAVVRKSLRRQRRSRGGELDIAGFVGVVVDVASRLREIAAEATALAAEPGGGRKVRHDGCGGASCSTEAHVQPRLGPFLIGYAQRAEPSDRGVEVGIDTEVLGTLVEGEPGLLSVIRVPTLGLDLATAELTFDRCGSALDNPVFTARGNLDGRPFTLTVNVYEYRFQLMNDDGPSYGKSPRWENFGRYFLSDVAPVLLEGVIELRLMWQPRVPITLRLPVEPASPGAEVPVGAAPAASKYVEVWFSAASWRGGPTPRSDAAQEAILLIDRYFAVGPVEASPGSPYMSAAVEPTNLERVRELAAQIPLDGFTTEDPTAPKTHFAVTPV